MRIATELLIGAAKVGGVAKTVCTCCQHANPGWIACDMLALGRKYEVFCVWLPQFPHPLDNRQRKIVSNIRRSISLSQQTWKQQPRIRIGRRH